MKHLPFSLALGAGGARGIAHLGILRVLERKEILPSLIVGTSMGAVMGAMYAQTLDTVVMEEKLERFFNSDFFRKIGLDFFILEDHTERHTILEQWINKAKRHFYLTRTLTRLGALPDQVLSEALSYLLEEDKIENLKIPFGAVATDLKTGEIVVIRNGSVTEAVAASSSIPAITTPRQINGRQLVDGGASCITPVIPARELSNTPVVAVDVWKILSHVKMPTRGLGVLLRSGEITQLNLNKLLVLQADVIVRPQVQLFHWANFAHYRDLITKGIEAMEIKINELYGVIEKKPVKRHPLLRKLFRLSTE